MATLTVGDGKTYSTIAAAIAAATKDDLIDIGYRTATGATHYYENFIDTTKPLTLRGAVPGISIVTPNTGNLLNDSSGDWYFENLIFDNSASSANQITIRGAFASINLNRCRIFAIGAAEFIYGLDVGSGAKNITSCMYVIRRSFDGSSQRIGANNTWLNNTVVLLGDNTALVTTGITATNNIFIANTDPLDGTNINATYNVSTVPITGTGNVTVDDMAAAGLVAAHLGGWNYRTLAGFEQPGIDTGVTTDIDGRPRTSFAIGATEGFDLIENADLPDATEVLTTATTGGVPGRWDPADPATVRANVTYGVDGTSEVGTYVAGSSGSAGGGSGAESAVEPALPFGLNDSWYTVADVVGDTFVLKDDEDKEYIDGSDLETEYARGGEVRKGVETLFGLSHLEGRQVVALADGSVVRGLTVEEGSIELERYASVVHVGLPYVAEAETMELDLSAEGGTLQDRKRDVVSLVVRLQDSREFWAGPNEDRIEELRFRQYEDYGQAIDLFTGDKEMSVYSGEERSAKVYFRNVDPVPCTVLAVIPKIVSGEY